mmetsp:Transcript_12505/g.34457  ORF Transcript_12505/g.34457 Transcript_12505/m.34457 type:complete len:276 (-) Transcript_12505:578-1405(-)
MWTSVVSYERFHRERVECNRFIRNFPERFWRQNIQCYQPSRHLRVPNSGLVCRIVWLFVKKVRCFGSDHNGAILLCRMVRLVLFLVSPVVVLFNGDGGQRSHDQRHAEAFQRARDLVEDHDVAKVRKQNVRAPHDASQPRGCQLAGAADQEQLARPKGSHAKDVPPDGCVERKVPQTVDLTHPALRAKEDGRHDAEDHKRSHQLEGVDAQLPRHADQGDDDGAEEASQNGGQVPDPGVRRRAKTLFFVVGAVISICVRICGSKDEAGVRDADGPD